MIVSFILKSYDNLLYFSKSAFFCFSFFFQRFKTQNPSRPCAARACSPYAAQGGPRAVGGGESVGSLWSCCRFAGGAYTDREKETDLETPAPLGCTNSTAEFGRFLSASSAASRRGRSRYRVTEAAPAPKLKKQQPPKKSNRKEVRMESPTESCVGSRELAKKNV